MKREDIIRMAREAGIVVIGEAVWRLCELVAAAEREACAQIADEWATREQKQFGNGGPGAAIRARGNQ